MTISGNSSRRKKRKRSSTIMEVLLLLKRIVELLASSMRYVRSRHLSFWWTVGVRPLPTSVGLLVCDSGLITCCAGRIKAVTEVVTDVK